MGKTKTAFVGETIEEPKKKTKPSSAKASADQKKVHISGLKGGQRIKIVSGEIPDIPTTPTTETLAKEEEKKRAKAKKRVRGKKYKGLATKIDKNKLYSLSDAIKLIKETSYSKFDGTMEMHLVVKKAGTQSQVTLPHSTGKTKKVEVASESTIKKLQDNKIDFDILLATADMMPKLIPFAKILGPKGLMPNPKKGTLVKNAEETKNFSVNSIALKTEKDAPLIHTAFGKVSQPDDELSENAQTIIKALNGQKQILKVYLKSTMSPSVKVQI